MRTLKVLFPVVFGILITFWILLGVARASGEPVSPAALPPDIIYVDVNNTSGTANGDSWATAYTDLGDALTDAGSGDWIWVATGIYTPGIIISDSFALKPGVWIYGGFDPAGGADAFSERDWEAYPTILSGDINGDDINTNGVVLTTTHIVGPNNYHVVTADGTSTPITGNTVLDGFIITAGQANGASYKYRNRGGGILCNGNNGGECSPSLDNLIFSGNFARMRGGGMYSCGVAGTSNPALTNVTFSSNSVSMDWNGHGGAMYNDGFMGTSSPVLMNVTFTGNSAKYYGGAMYNYGREGTSSPRMVNVAFTGNSAVRGGALFNSAADLGTSSPRLTNVTFSGNLAEKGGAIYNWGLDGACSPGLNNIIMWGNTAVISGSQMYNEDASVTITTSLVQGGLVGSGVYNDNGTVIDGGGNLSADPHFLRDPDPGPDGNWDGVNDDYGDLHLKVSSPAIDTGTDDAITLTVDLDGNPRKVDGDGDGTITVDMGAYEYNCLALAGGIMYVDHTASGTGSSWEDAHPDLALVLDLVDNYCPNVQVWVATGVYKPGTQRSDSFELKYGVAVYGGFDPAGGADEFNERDWDAYPTILSGDIGGDDTNTDGVVMTTTHIVGDNSYHVVVADGTITPISGNTILDGFTITAGQASGSDPNHQGGGFYCDASVSGAECSPTLNNLTFSGNWADAFGGAMYNNGEDGTSSPSLEHVAFSGNSVGYDGGAMYNHGHYGTSSPILEDVIFSDNSADRFGGAMCNNGYVGTSSPILEDVTFSSNSADDGGAMYNDGGGVVGTSSPILTNVTFSGNFAVIDGGGMYNVGAPGISSPDLSNVIFSGNSAGDEGGAMYNLAIFSGISSPSLANVTFSGNHADYGGAMYNGDDNLGTSSPSLDNLILWGNTAVISGSQMYNDKAGVVITTSLVQGGLFGSGVYNDNCTIIDGGGNLSTDPNFVRDPDPGPDGNWDGVDDDYGDLHLKVDSPAIDTGTNDAITLTVDLDGNPRVVDGDGDGTATVDMGAYEFPPAQMLTVVLAGDGRGTVTGDGINCFTGTGADCTETYPYGTSVTLSASADPGSTFTGWGGSCSGTGDCQVTMDAPVSVTATFADYEVVSLPPGGGTVSTADGVLIFEAPGTLTQTIHISYTPMTTPTHRTGDFMFAGVVFHLEATDQNGDPLVTLATPISLTVAYDEAALPPDVDEANLELRRYDLDLGDWVPLTVIDRDLAANTLTVLLDHFSEFALFGGKFEVYLPLVLIR
jgi:hypothetical protein